MMIRFVKSVFIVSMLCTFGCVLVGCGQSGKLYLPQQQQGKAQ